MSEKNCPVGPFFMKSSLHIEKQSDKYDCFSDRSTYYRMFYNCAMSSKMFYKKLFTVILPLYLVFYLSSDSLSPSYCHVFYAEDEEISDVFNYHDIK